MDTKYQSIAPISLEDHLIEECAELIQALCKLKRFGAVTIDPCTNKNYNNLIDVLCEMHDVRELIDEFVGKHSGGAAGEYSNRTRI